MLKEFAALTETQAWAIGLRIFVFSILLFIILFRVFRGKRKDYEEFGRIPFGNEPNPDDTASSTDADERNQHRV